MGEAAAGPLVKQLPSGGVLVSAVVQWPHQRGGQAHCLGRLVVLPSGQVVGVLSELRTNPRGRGITSGAADAATTLMQLATTAGALGAASAGGEAETAVWVLHHGPFSSYDNPDTPETLTVAGQMRWDGHRYTDDVYGHRLLTADEVAKLVPEATLEPVPAVLVRLGQQW